MTITVQPHSARLGLRPGRLLIDGEWTAGTSGRSWTHRHPASGEAIGEFVVAGLAEVDAAVAAARAAFDSGVWSRARATTRIQLLHRYAESLRAHAEELRGLLALDNGVPVSFGNIYAVSVDAAADCFDHHAGWVDNIGGETLPPYQGGDHRAMTFREPIGVVAAILPWNAPFLLFAQKVAPALAAGCSVVLKPSEYATFSVLRMVELLIEAGLPAGVLNVVTGTGHECGEALIAAMATMGAVTLGLSGQACVVNTRAPVHRSVCEEFLAAARGIAAAVTYGDPFEPAVTSSPLINDRQLDRVLGYIQAGIDSGARLVCGGERLAGEYAAGNFVAPTIFAEVDNRSAIAREEGTIGINGFQVEPHLPFGGFAESGLGREGGRTAFEAYTELKTVMMPLGEELM